MTHSQGIGNEQPRDRVDCDGDGAPDQSELDFEEAGQAAPQPADARPGPARARPAPDASPEDAKHRP